MEIIPESAELSLSGENLLKLMKDVHMKGGSLRFTAKGYSMTPSIRHNDVITISPLPDRNLRSGDIVLFKKDENSQIVVHRIIKKRSGNYLMRGDNSDESDGWVTGNMIYGVVTGIERNGRTRFCAGSSDDSFSRSILLKFYYVAINLRRKIVKFIMLFRKKRT
ncbi:MAG: S24/S26 family peptidase [Candidatus Aminicenantes bacterium]|nr:S24/S26 family peptidase [Candidatus Aminicenantes bacterium]MCK5004632.1 S24/S26 family peptidase [Candidatus Aminicenantes bacterium]